MKKILKYFVYFCCLLTIFNIIDLFFDKIYDISDISNQNKIFIYDSDSNVIYEQTNSHQSSYVKFENINDIVKMVFLEVEDRRFYQHIGIDPISTTKAFFSNIVNDTLIGGSTITQQYVKNLYLTNEKTYIRKIKECYYALRVENLYTKDEIFEGYLNTIYFNNGVYGINDAALYYFNKTPDELNLKEATCLVSIIKSPSNYCLISNYDKNISRTNDLLLTLYKRGSITKKDYNEAILQEIEITKTRNKLYTNSVLYFKDYVLNQMNEITKETHIYTNFNSELNLYIDSLIENIQCDVSIVVMDKNGYICSVIGNKNYYESSYNIATSASRMIGSTIKPMLYYEALSFGMNQTNTFISEEKDLIVNDEIISVNNFNNTYDNCPITMEYAIATSDNIYAMKTHLFIGTNKLPSFLNKFGITAINDKYTIALGTQDMSLLTLSSIYNTFLNKGLYSKPKGFTFYKQDNTIINNIVLKEEILSNYHCNTVNNLLTSTFDTSLNQANNVTGTSISHLLNKTVAAKTGLTDYDSYMVGYTSDYVVSIWVGHSDNSLLNEYKNKKLPKELFYKIINMLPDSSYSIFDE